MLDAALTAGTLDGLIRSNAIRASSDPTTDGYFIYSDIRLALDGTHIKPAAYQLLHAEHRAAILRGNTAGDEPTFTVGQSAIDTFTRGPAGASITAAPMDSRQTWLRDYGGDFKFDANGEVYQAQNGNIYLLDPTKLSRNHYLEIDYDKVSPSSAQVILYTRYKAAGPNYKYRWFPGGNVDLTYGTTTLANCQFAIPGR